MKNTPVFNHFRFIFVFLLVLCAGLLVVLRDIISAHLEYGFLITGLCAGFIFCLAMPLSRVGWDEETHLRSVYWLDITGSYEYNCFLHNYIDGGAENLTCTYLRELMSCRHRVRLILQHHITGEQAVLQHSHIFSWR